jgi:GT2 family glycosyltransferase
MPTCAVVIPVHNKAELTAQCLSSLEATLPAHLHIEVVVVDDASSDATQEVLARHAGRVGVVRHETNRGFASACNSGAASTAGDYLVFLNNDTQGTPGWLEALVRYAEAHEEAGAIGSKLLFPNGTVQHAGVVIRQDGFPHHIYAGFPNEHPAVNRSRRFQSVTAACALIRRDAFDEIGGFDEEFRNGYEDVDLCLRLAGRGWEVHYCHESVLYHLEFASRDRRYRDFERNERLFRARWLERVRRDDLDYYVDDGLLEVEYPELYPLRLSVSPLLAAVVDASGERLADWLLYERSHQVIELMRENNRLRARTGERAFQAYGDRHPS